jgi:hypothetical protein
MLVVTVVQRLFCFKSNPANDDKCAAAGHVVGAAKINFWIPSEHMSIRIRESIITPPGNNPGLLIDNHQFCWENPTSQTESSGITRGLLSVECACVLCACVCDRVKRSGPRLRTQLIVHV